MTHPLIKNGPGTLTLSGVESGYNGPTTINQGILAVAAGYLSLSAGAVLDYEFTLGSALAAPGTITLDGSKTVGTLQFDNANGYTVAAGSGGSLVLDSGANPAQLSVLQGTHAISAPVTLTSATAVDTTAGSTSRRRRALRQPAGFRG